MTILITGGSGMLGRNMKDVANAKGVPVLTPGRDELDLASRESVERWLEANRPDLVIHCAGHVGGIQANLADPMRFLMLNLDMGMNLVRAADDVGVPRLINVGSSCMYPRDAPNPLREEAILDGRLEPTNEGYALAKILTAKICEYITMRSPERIYRTVIPCNLYGRYDHFEHSRSHLVPAVIRKVHEARQAGAEAISLWGDGTARREFMYAADAAELIFAAAHRSDELPQYMNIGLGHDHSVLDYYKAAAIAVGWSGRYEIDLTKPTGMKQKLVDTGRQRSLGLAASTTLLDGLRLTHDYFLEVHHAN